jgi:hypothetical protein
MKRAVTLWLSIFLFCALRKGDIPLEAYYKALSSGEETSIDHALEELEHEKQSPKIEAYIGAMTMKKAGFIKGVNGKVKTFKKGAQLLENAIRNNPSNTEFRFLRLTVQEHAPNILKYNKQLDEDRNAVVAGYDKLDAALKSVVANYARDSKILKASDLK